MLSILIPTYNHDVRPLLEELRQQAEALCARQPDFDYEIIVLDDASTLAHIRQLMKSLPTSERLRLILSEANMGRSAARNRLIDEARGQYLLFMDCDAMPTQGYVATHWADRMRADVVCGALQNPPPPPPWGHELRYRYEQQAERKGKRTAKWRNEHPFEEFSVFNTLMSAEVTKRLRFDERISEYGYEDVIFGRELQRMGFSVLHTDNAAIHTGINSNEDFLLNTEAAMRTLSRLDPKQQEGVTICKWARKMRSLRLSAMLVRIYTLVRPRLRNHLLGHRPSLWAFNFYKLGYYLQNNT